MLKVAEAQCNDSNGNNNSRIERFLQRMVEFFFFFSDVDTGHHV